MVHMHALTLTPKVYSTGKEEEPDPVTLYKKPGDSIPFPIPNATKKINKNTNRYTVIDGLIGFPIVYAMENIGLPEKDEVRNYGDAIDVKFNGKLWDKKTDRFYQTPVVETVLQHIKTEGKGGLLCLPTGSGKTQMAMYFIATMARKTLIIVDNSKLLEQWKTRIESTLPTARVGVIKGPKAEVNEKDVVIGMLQTIALKDNFDIQLFKSFGMVIIDEVHVVAA